MDDVSTAFLGCGGGTRNERVIPRVEETTRGFLITVNAPGARAEDVHANATNPPVLKRWTSWSPASSPPSSSMPRSKLPRPVSYRRPKHLRRSTTMAESKTSPNNENIYATFTQHLRNIYTTFCNARTH